MNVYFNFPSAVLSGGRQRTCDVTFASRCLMEGLSGLGHRFGANRDIGESAGLPGYVPDLRETDCEIIVVDIKSLSDLESYQDFSEMLEPAIRRRKENPRLFSRTVFLDGSDRAGSNYFSDPSILLLTLHMNRFVRLRGDRRPWTYGIRQSFIDRSQDRREFLRRRPAVLRNFKPSNLQSVRAFLDLTFIPKLQRLVPELAVDREISDSGRQGDGHFRRLGEYRFCLACCGHFVQHLVANPHLRDGPIARAFGRVEAQSYIERWDSFRFWESLAMGCLTINLDLGKYGFELPVQPEAGKHYLALDLDEPDALIGRMTGPPEALGEIAEAGRAWVIEHYSPAAQARRLIAAVQEHARA